MKIDGVDFNKEWAKTKTSEEFVNEFKDMDHIYPDHPNKEAKLRSVHAQLTAKEAAKTIEDAEEN